MRAQAFHVAGGNPTLLVWGCHPGTEGDWIARYLGNGIEQIGFVDESGIEPALTMMGDELCVNATLVLASLGGAKGVVRASGIESLVRYANGEATSVSFKLPFFRDGEVVVFAGIGYRCTKTPLPSSKELLAEYARIYDVPAFGIVQYESGRIRPQVYVVATDSLCEESACGSGSIATHIVTGETRITQPTGETISVYTQGHHVSVSAVVRSLG